MEKRHFFIFTNSKLMTMKLINYNVCDVCEKEVENITHLFLLCSELVEFHLFMQQKLSVLFDNVDSDKIDNLVLRRGIYVWFIWIYQRHKCKFCQFHVIYSEILYLQKKEFT